LNFGELHYLVLRDSIASLAGHALRRRRHRGGGLLLIVLVLRAATGSQRVGILIRRARLQQRNRQQESDQLVVLLPKVGDKAKRDSLADRRADKNAQQLGGKRD
jgi:hypothetical protein